MNISIVLEFVFYKGFGKHVFPVVSQQVVGQQFTKDQMGSSPQ